MKSVASCPLIKSILVLDGEGKRIAVKYFDPELWVFFLIRFTS
jgi:hypothetical protein